MSGMTFQNTEDNFWGDGLFMKHNVEQARCVFTIVSNMALYDEPRMRDSYSVRVTFALEDAIQE